MKNNFLFLFLANKFSKIFYNHNYFFFSESSIEITENLFFISTTKFDNLFRL